MQDMCIPSVLICCLCVYLFPYVLSLNQNRIQYEMLCVDSKCSEPISLAKGVVPYSYPQKNGVLAFSKDEEMIIYSKPVKEDSKWGYANATIVAVAYTSKKSGLVPFSLIRDYVTYKKQKDLIRVLTKEGRKRKEEADNLEVNKEKVLDLNQNVAGGVAAEVGDGGPAAKPFDIVDGTTVYMETNGENSVQATSTLEPSLNTKSLLPTQSAEVVSEWPDPSKLSSHNTNNYESENNDDQVDEDDNDEEEEEEEEEEVESEEEVDKLETVSDEPPKNETQPEPLTPSDKPSTSGAIPADPENSKLNSESSIDASQNMSTSEPPEPSPTFPLPVQPTAESNPQTSNDKSEPESSPSTTDVKKSTQSKVVEENPDLESNADPGKSSEVDEIILASISSNDGDGVKSESETSSAISEALAPTPVSKLPSTLSPDSVQTEITPGVKSESETSSAISEPLAPTPVLKLPNTLSSDSVETENILYDLNPPNDAKSAATIELKIPTHPETQEQVALRKPRSVNIEDSQHVPQPYPPETHSSHLEDKSFSTDPVRSNSPEQIATLPPTISSDYQSSESPSPDASFQADPSVASHAEVPVVGNQPSLYPGLFPISESSRPSMEPNTEEGEITRSAVEPVTVPTLQTPSLSEQNEDSSQQVQHSGFFGGIFGSIEQSKNELPTDQVSADLPSIPTIESGAVPEGECKDIPGLESDCADAPSPPHLLQFFENTTPGSSYTSLYLVITSITVLIFTLGYYFIERTRQDGPLIAKVNRLTHELQVATSQLESNSFQESLTLTEASNEVLATIQTELNDLKRTKAEMESQIESLQQELDTATEAGLESNRMLSDMLGQQQDSDYLLKSVEQLEGQLNAQQRIIDEMNRSLFEKSEESKQLQSELTETQMRAESLETELKEMRDSLNNHLKDNEAMKWELEARNSELEAELALVTEKKEAEVEALSKSVAELTQKATVRDSEFHALKDTIEVLRSQGQVDPEALYDVGHVKAELARAQAEKESLQERLIEEEGAMKLLRDHVNSVDEEVASLRLSFEAADRDKVEAERKLFVLSEYFKEKETKLQKELGLQEAKWGQMKGEEITVYERIKSLEEEVESYNFDSFNNSNEGRSVTNSLSSIWTDPSSVSPNRTNTDPPSSTSNVLPEKASPKLTESLWSLPEVTKCNAAESLSLRSLPLTSNPKPRVVPRRKSSMDFEAKLERVQLMTAIVTPTSRPVPEDLLKLQELKTVRASPFRDVSSSPDLNKDNSDSKLENVATDRQETKIKCSDLVDKFEKFRKPATKVRCLANFKKESNSQDTIEKICKHTGFGDVFGSLTKKDVPINLLPFDLENSNGQNTGNIITASDEPTEVLSMPLIPIPAPRTVPERIQYYKSESEDSQSFSKDCEIGSSATLEFDIKVVANTSANVKKFKKKCSRPKNGSQNDLLKKEIIEQERGLKGQIATLEKKAHENWVAARQFERRLEESKQEAGQLRNMLTLMEKPMGSEVDGKPPPRHPGELNGEDTFPPHMADGTSPLPMPPFPMGGPPPLPPPGMPMPFSMPFMPPPPGGFMPPPPLLPGDHRPPPLGRMSSPPLNRFSPAPGDFYEMSPPPLSPPVRNYRSSPVRRSPPSHWDEPSPRSGFRPVVSQRDQRRDYKGSNLNSDHSSLESLDKQPKRRGK